MKKDFYDIATRRVPYKPKAQAVVCVKHLLAKKKKKRIYKIRDLSRSLIGRIYKRIFNFV